jgi:hypothetical protein
VKLLFQFPFCLDMLKKELNFLEFAHILFILIAIFSPKNNPEGISDDSFEKWLGSNELICTIKSSRRIRQVWMRLFTHNYTTKKHL